MRGLKILKVDKSTLKIKINDRKTCIDKIKIVDNSYNDEEEKKFDISK